MHFPWKNLAKIVLLEKLNFSEKTIIKNPFCIFCGPAFHYFYKLLQTNSNGQFFFLMENFSFSAGNSVVAPSVSINLTHLLCKKEERTGQSLDNLINKNTKRNIGEHIQKNMVWRWLQRYNNFFVMGTVSCVVIKALIQLIIIDSFQTLCSPEPSFVV